jgi:putative redox protein
MTSSTTNAAPVAQATVSGELHDGATFSGRAGASELSLGGPPEHGGNASGSNPYDLLSASLAACTAMTMRMHARHKQYPLSHVEVGVSYRHAAGGERGSFERTITMRGDLDDLQRAELLRGAIACPVARTLEAGAVIDTSLAGHPHGGPADPLANYFEDLFSLVNVDPD